MTIDPRPILIAFGDLVKFDPRLKADYVYSSLMAAEKWLVSQRRNCLVPGAPIMFYQNRLGFVGTAAIAQVAQTSSADSTACPGLPLKLFPYRISLEKIRVFPRPIDCRPLIADLTFIKNKKSWGLAFMGTPRLIPKGDFGRIVKAKG